MTNLAPDVLGPTVTIGEILVEIVATSEGEGFLEPFNLIGPFPSGAPAIFIDQCARIGGSAAIVGVVGNDDFEIAVGLRGKRSQRGVKRVLPIEGRHDNRNEKRAAHNRPPTPKLRIAR